MGILVAVRPSFFHKFGTASVAIPCSLSLLLLVQTILRLPNFFEPYWYGDEGIYLTIGTALNRGARLYTDIVDHKTPLIYIFAQVGSQLAFRVLLFFWLMAATMLFFFLAKKLLKKNWAVILASSVFMVFTTLPWFEGNIPNGELFVIGFVLAGLWLISQTPFFENAVLIQTSQAKLWSIGNSLRLFFGGSLLSLAILTKIPAIFDLAAVVSLAYFSMLNTVINWPIKLTAWWQSLRVTVLQGVIIGLGVALPILLSILYFVAQGSGSDYLQFGLLYNFQYSGSWQLDVTNPMLVFFFTLPGKIAFLVATFGLLTIFAKFLPNQAKFTIGWFALAFIASLLSNRPYSHYFMQAIPPLAVLLAMTAENVWPIAKLPQKKLGQVITLLFSGGLVSFFIATLFIMHVGLYPTWSYYRNFYAYSTGKMPRAEYFESFNYLMAENYHLAAIIKADAPDKIFIWGTNPMLYALSATRPVGRFTVAFHIEDLGVQAETIQKVREALPLYIVVMRDQNSSLPGLSALLSSKYLPFETTQHMIVWKKLSKYRYN